jgi:hypothetical protein
MGPMPHRDALAFNLSHNAAADRIAKFAWLRKGVFFSSPKRTIARPIGCSEPRSALAATFRRLTASLLACANECSLADTQFRKRTNLPQRELNS